MLRLLQFRSVVAFPVPSFAIHTAVVVVFYQIHIAAAAVGFPCTNWYLLHIHPLEIAVEGGGH